MHTNRKKFLGMLFSDPLLLTRKIPAEKENHLLPPAGETAAPAEGLFSQEEDAPLLGNPRAPVGILCDNTLHAGSGLPAEDMELLKKILLSASLSLDEVWVIVFDFGKWKSTHLESMILSLHSSRQLKGVFAFGEQFSRQLFRKPLSHLRGQPEPFHNIPVICTHAIGALQNNNVLKRETWSDIIHFRDLIPA